MQYVYRNFDGPLYIIVAKTFYNPKLIEKIGLELPISPNYFAAHLPLYPILIRGVRELVGLTGLRVNGLEYLKSMVFVNLAATVFLSLFFYFFLKKFKLTTKPLLLVAVFLFLPKFLVVRSIGAPESLFLLLILISLYFFEKENYLWAGLAGAFAVVTKTPGILLFFAYVLVFLERWLKMKKISWLWVSVLLIPLALLAVFSWYYRQYGDFFAYFHSGDNIHLALPFSVFNFQKVWVGTAWLEEIIFYFFLYGLTVYSLKNSRYRSLYYFSLVFYIAIILVQHRDISRYSLPLWPMAIIGLEKFFTSKKFLTVFMILLLAIYFYSWNFIVFNAMPISNWRPFL
ncbi:hypothetical protein COS31_05120 [Candidatus Roizmanbacteria bacterium CG02_land_8_20_14_3_00_36_15]|uniref:Glycosyltransferase RgtA/B/C/D-like domain-containing protein n=1 Tax=Candidatus Roizmanbacteria bacterium CG10_big_fil_rev_8_21_14_0_10_36_26 TaxID=1974851 RepID=A0A2M8KK43_9BACT|nr:MAG: hypothetical protein COS51_02320 [Candidatus Roizmanbacteria bacterium CG03_land_8_20_14_0_80_36_21]PIV37313.1 MAG: hypothetical protein COS31_05120 [Candidatus Roizmanbacteria bacterium CG02_land_8_20_14_3_00_36_15]PIY69789.1 MAG: hypothetical protein COY89_04720 [Candidatus Roizmanbacteria bacterium CG_4_10_14_0_8_um_filter_36_36]PJE60296.1 MAG: hypothetical protein COU86_05305 [Candidatus Roizmanbacteria bacterium CG10_big_fil_rev_8_21_14_0_10_36_26]